MDVQLKTLIHLCITLCISIEGIYTQRGSHFNDLIGHDIGQVTDYLGYKGKGRTRQVKVNSIVKTKKKYGYGYNVDRHPKGVQKPIFYSVNTNPDFHLDPHDKDLTATLLFTPDDFSGTKHGIVDDSHGYGYKKPKRQKKKKKKQQRYPSKYPENYPRKYISDDHHSGYGDKKDDSLQGLIVIPAEIEKPKVNVYQPPKPTYPPPHQTYPSEQQQYPHMQQQQLYSQPQQPQYGPPEDAGYRVSSDPYGYKPPTQGYGAPTVEQGYGPPPDPHMSQGYGHQQEPEPSYGPPPEQGYGHQHQPQQGYGPPHQDQGYNPHEGFQFGVQVSYKPEQQQTGYGQPTKQEYPPQYGSQPSYPPPQPSYGGQPAHGYPPKQEEQEKEKVSGLLILLKDDKNNKKPTKGYDHYHQKHQDQSYPHKDPYGHDQSGYGAPDPHSDSYGFQSDHDEGYGYPKRKIIKRKKKKRPVYKPDPYHGFSKDEKVVLLYK